MTFDPMPPLDVSADLGPGPKDVLFAADGAVFTGLADGRLLRLAPAADKAETIAQTGGRLMGLEFLKAQEILICDAHRGLLSADITNGRLRELASEFEGRKLTFCNNAAVAKDGTIYFSQASTRLGASEANREILEHIPSGRLLRRSPEGEIDCLIDNLQFAGGVVLSADQRYVLVAETGAARIMRYWLTEEKQGQTDIFADNLPGLPDNLSLGSDGLIWVALAAPMTPQLQKLHGASPWIRKIVAFLLDGQPSDRKAGVQIAAYDQQGRRRYQLRGTDDKFHMATGVREQNGQVMIASINGDRIAGFEFSRSTPATGTYKKLRIRGNRYIGYYDSGAGKPVVLSASLGRSVSDFNDLVDDLNRAGYRTLAVESRGIGPGLRAQRFRPYDLFALADDIAAVLAFEQIPVPVSIIGHAYGDRVARSFAAKYPKRVDDIIMLAAGGASKVAPEVERALRDCFNRELPFEQMEDALRTAYFAPDAVIPDDWHSGWHNVAALGQSGAMRRSEPRKWRLGGGKPALLLQGKHDVFSPAELICPAMKRLFGDRIETVTLEKSAHAILPEQPSDVAREIIHFLGR